MTLRQFSLRRERVLLWRWFRPLCVLVRVPYELVFQHPFAGLFRLRREYVVFVAQKNLVYMCGKERYTTKLDGVHVIVVGKK